MEPVSAGSLIFLFSKSGPMPMKFWKDEAPPKGVSNRNEALRWLLQHLSNNDNDDDDVRNDDDDRGVIYIADDDNTYDLDLFHEVFFRAHSLN